MTATLIPKMSDFSPVSQQRLESGHSLRILDSKSPVDQEVISSLELPDIDDYIEQPWRDMFADLEELLTLNKISYKRNRKLVRGLDYYNGTCFEVK